ncbi:MAG: sulfatase-like hydrolase/transferase [Verrucomicrobiota bacterium]
MKRATQLLLSTLLSQALSAAPLDQPNILWIITDDHRPDSIQAYNRAVSGKDHSPLGYVESPHTDQLASEGVLFTNAFTNSPVCAPSRGAMHSGRYPFRSGHYAFELTHQAPDFVRPVISQTLRDHGYATATFGKEDHYIYRWGPGQGFHKGHFFDHSIHFKHDLQKNGLGDLFTKLKYAKDKDGRLHNAGSQETVVYPDGSTRSYLLNRDPSQLAPEDRAGIAQSNREFGLLRGYTRSSNLIILGGTNPKPAGQTVDAYIVKELTNYLANAGQTYPATWGKTQFQGADPTKPQFLHLGFHLPHTPVLPPKSYRDRFKTKTYQVPAFDKEAELARLPSQIQRIYNSLKIDGLTESEKQIAIQDYYAFCSYGDTLLGEAITSFKNYCQTHQQDYLILYVIGDHGWHLHEQGIEGKTGPWRQSVANAAILVSSDDKKLKRGSINRDLVEFIDFAPTFLTAAGLDPKSPDFAYLDGIPLFDTIQSPASLRDYIIGQTTVICGPRSYLHTHRFRFSMRTRPFQTLDRPGEIGKDPEWALNAPRNEVEMVLYDLKTDPLERNNLANDLRYAKLADWFRQKLGKIVLGDGRIECDWSQENTYSLSNFYAGAHDRKADIPPALIPPPKPPKKVSQN